MALSIGWRCNSNVYCCRETVSLCRNAHLPQYDRNNKYQWQCTLHLGKVHMESDPGHVCSHSHTKSAEKRGCSLNHNDTTHGLKDGMRKQRTMLCAGHVHYNTR